MGGLIRFFAIKSIFVNLIVVIVTLTDFFIYFKSPKEIFPNIELGIVVVNAIYPQAASVEVEKLVINLVEEAVKNLKGVKELYSTRSALVSTIIVQAEEGYNIKKLSDNVKKAVDKINTLPEEANDPQIIEITSKEFWNYNDDFIRGNLWTKMESSKTVIESKTSKISGIGKIKKWGYFDKAIWVNARKDDFKRYNITICGLMNVLKDRNIYACW